MLGAIIPPEPRPEAVPVLWHYEELRPLLMEAGRLLTELRPDHVHILVKGRIVARGGAELADLLDVEGYAAFVPAEDLAVSPVPARPGSLDELFAL